MSGTFLNTLKFLVKDCDPATGEPESEDSGFDDEYVVSFLCVVMLYLLIVAVCFRVHLLAQCQISQY